MAARRLDHSSIHASMEQYKSTRAAVANYSLFRALAGEIIAIGRFNGRWGIVEKDLRQESSAPSLDVRYLPRNEGAAEGSARDM